jgi:phospholipase C
MLADHYTMSDNYQPSMGGTGLDGIMAGFGDAIYYSDGKRMWPRATCRRFRL